MEELNNIASANGNYNDVPTSVTSNVYVVNMIEGLTLKKEANQKNWINGNLTYTITLSNLTDTTYVKPIITDEINTTLVNLIKESITINGTKATEDQYSYDENTHILKVNLDDVGANETVTLTFSVEKKV